jgi:hypothetical protein
MANVCACGCGELLPEGSTRQFKRGHKQRIENPGSDVTDITDAGQDEVFSEEIPLTLDDVARITPDDPEPKDAPEFRPKTVVKITAGVRRDIEGKLALGFGILGQTWSMIDPLCGSTLVNCGPEMAKKYTPIVCKSPEVVKWMTKSGNFLMWIEALMATWPVLEMMAAHHVFHNVVPVNPAPSANGSHAPSEYVVQ